MQGARQRTGPASRPTLDSVASRARVSRQTVSNVLNNPGVVRPETLERVRAAIDELGYRPSSAARQLRTRRSRTLGMRLEPVRDGVNGSVLDRFLHAFVEAGQERSYRVLLFTAGDDAAEVAAYDDLLATSDLDGFLVTGTHHGDPRTAWLDRRGTAYVTFGRPWGAAASHPWVDVQGSAGTRDAVRHLVASGHRRIAFVGWPAGSGVGDDRRAGWRAGLADAGLPPRAALDASVEDGLETGRTAVAAMLASGEPPTAVVCASDSLALGALAARDALQVEMAVVGFDDTAVAAAVGLTSIAQPLAEAARACLDLLVTTVEGPPPPTPQHVLLPPRLVVRSSA